MAGYSHVKDCFLFFFTTRFTEYMYIYSPFDLLSQHISPFDRSWDTIIAEFTHMIMAQRTTVSPPTFQEQQILH